MSAPSYNILGRFVPKTNGTAGSSTTPPASALVTGELATNSFLGDLFSKKEDGAVALVGANAKQIAGRTITAATPNDGEYVKWDATTGQFVYGTASVSASASAPVLTTFTGNGTQTLFPINGYTNNVQTNYFVSVGGVIQKPDNGTFTVSASGIQLSSAPAIGVPGFVLALQAPITNNALANTTAEEIDLAFRGSSTGVLAIGNSNYYGIANTQPTVSGCVATVISSTVVQVSGFVPSTATNYVTKTSGSNILTMTAVPAVIQSLKPGHLITGTGIPAGATLVSASSTQIVMSAAATVSSSGLSSSITIKGTTQYNVNNGFPLALTGLVSGVFTIASISGSTINLYCRSGATVGTVGAVDIQACTLRSISIGFGAGVGAAPDAVQVGNAASAVQPANASASYSLASLVAIGNEAQAVSNAVAVGANSLAQTTGAVALGDGTVAGDDVRDNLPYDTMICSGTTGTATLTVLCGDTVGMSVGMLVSGTGIPANATVASILSDTSFTISANLTATITASAVTFAYAVSQTFTGNVLSGSNVVRVNEVGDFGAVGDYVTASQFPTGTRIIDVNYVFDGTNTYNILTLSRDATATLTTAAFTTKSEGRFRRILTGSSVASGAATYTVSSTANICVGDLYDVYNADGSLTSLSGRVGKISSATVFYGSAWNFGAALSSKVIVFKKQSSAIAIGKSARAATGELGLCHLNVQQSSGTANVAYAPINIGGKDFLIPLNARA